MHLLLLHGIWTAGVLWGSQCLQWQRMICPSATEKICELLCTASHSDWEDGRPSSLRIAKKVKEIQRFFFFDTVRKGTKNKGGGLSTKIHQSCDSGHGALDVTVEPVSTSGVHIINSYREGHPVIRTGEHIPLISKVCPTYKWGSFYNDRLVGGDWTWILWLSIQLGMSSSELTLTPSFFRGVRSTTNQITSS